MTVKNVQHFRETDMYPNEETTGRENWRERRRMRLIFAFLRLVRREYRFPIPDFAGKSAEFAGE